MIVPDTDVYLIKCPLEISDSNQLTFANATAQYNYFQSLPKLYLDSYTYQRKDGVLRVGELMDDIQEYNYVMYRNTNHSSKWFYAFITNMEYLNDNVTAVSIATDCWQTWQFDLTYKKTFIEREHVNDDSFGIHTIPENLDVGEYIALDSYNYTPYKDSWAYGDNRNDPTKKIKKNVITFQVTSAPPHLTIQEFGDFALACRGYYNNLFSGMYYFGVNTPDEAREIITAYTEDGKDGNIVSIFYAPCAFFDLGVKVTHTYNSTLVSMIVPPSSTDATVVMSRTNLARPTTIDSYTPKNNKMFTYPFCYIDVDNNAGTSAQYRYEDFVFYSGQQSFTTPRFIMQGALGQGSAIKLFPENYKNNALDYVNGVVGAKFPQCAWKSDYYTNWCIQNAVNMPATALSNSIGAGLGIAAGAITASTGGVAAAFGLLQVAQAGATYLSGITDTMGKTHAAQHQSDQSRGNASTGDLNIATGRYFTVKRMNIKREFAKICDDFLSTFGYKVNEVKIPNITGRRNWNYVKTVGCYIEGDIPQEDMEEIKSMFDKGITFWHNPTTFMDYSQNNDII